MTSIFLCPSGFPVYLLYLGFMFGNIIKAIFISFQAESTGATNESVLKVPLDQGKSAGVIKLQDRAVICQKVGDALVKIIELEDEHSRTLLCNTHHSYQF